MGGARTRVRLVTVAAVGALLAAAACSDDPAPADGAATEAEADAVELRVLSTDASRITGGDALIEVSEPVDDAAFEVDGEALEVVESPSADGRRTFLVSGIPDGPATVQMTAGDATAELDVVGHPISGPVFSGPHLPMPTCTTETFDLGPASDDGTCWAESTTTHEYVDAAGRLQPLDDPDAPPADAYLATTGPNAGSPVVVTVETSVVNRGVATITTPYGREWNRRLVYRFGGGCGTSFSQGFDLMRDPDPEVLAAGYATATNTLNTLQVNCNDVVSAESAMMTKERFVERFGVPEHTLGEGGSGGAIQQLLIAQNYPGILDAIAPTLPFPDAVSISGGVVDCSLLSRYYGLPAAASLTGEQRTAINGHLTPTTCTFWDQTFASSINPSTCGFRGVASAASGAIPGAGGAGLPRPPEELIWDAETNPTGLRCTLQDGAVNVYGRDPTTGFAPRPWDNVGIQYGLAALNDGTITFDQFFDVNMAIGSYDINGEWTSGRAEAEADVIETAYRTGRVVAGGGDLADIPILLVNVYTDAQGDIHDRFRAFTLLDRLSGDDGQPSNLAIWTRRLPDGSSLVDTLTGAINLGADVIGALDRWVTDGDAATNGCFEHDGALIEEGDDVYDGPGPCTDPFPIKGDPRTVAGAPRSNDVLKCELRSVRDAVDDGVYEVELTDAQVGNLESIFPDGVCDWSKPGVGRVPLGDPWQSYG